MIQNLQYSRYDGSGSSVYAVKLGVERIMTNPVDAYSYNSGIEGNDTETHPGFTEEPTPEALAEMKLTPYKGLSSETIIRYLYTGREYNIETGDYYYRYRMMEAGIGRFTSKDPVERRKYYSYVLNNPINYFDSMGTNTTKDIFISSDFFNEIEETTALLIEALILIPYEDNSKFKHCYGACLLTNWLGARLTLLLQSTWESISGKQGDWADDNFSALMGTGISRSGMNCAAGCALYQNMWAEMPSALETIQHDVISEYNRNQESCTMEIRTTPWEASIQTSTR